MNKHIFFLIPALILVGLLVGCNSTEFVAEVLEFSGKVNVKLDSSSSSLLAQKNQKLPTGAILQSGEDSSAKLSFIENKTHIEIFENTYFEIKNFSEKELVQLGGVVIYRVTPQDSELRIQTPHGVAVVLGTTFRIDVDDTSTILQVEEGKVRFESDSETHIVSTAQVLYSDKAGGPQNLDPFSLNEFFTPSENGKIHFNMR